MSFLLAIDRHEAATNAATQPKPGHSLASPEDPADAPQADFRPAHAGGATIDRYR
jgi:hypothetical protein